MTVHQLRDAAGQPQKRFTGAKLAHTSTGEHRNLPRWLTLDLFLKQDGTYILHRIGYSVVYHSVEGPCEGGEKMTYATLADITDEGEPCTKCHPIPFKALMAAVESGHSDANSKSVALEHNYYKVLEIPDVPTLISELEFVPKNSRTGERVISRPGQELLLRAADLDPRISAVFEAVKDI
jgi:hypothetical protein